MLTVKVKPVKCVECGCQYILKRGKYTNRSGKFQMYRCSACGRHMVGESIAPNVKNQIVPRKEWEKHEPMYIEEKKRKSERSEEEVELDNSCEEDSRKEKEANMAKFKWIDEWISKSDQEVLREEVKTRLVEVQRVIQDIVDGYSTVWDEVMNCSVADSAKYVPAYTTGTYEARSEWGACYNAIIELKMKMMNEELLSLITEKTMFLEKK